MRQGLDFLLDTALCQKACARIPDGIALGYPDGNEVGLKYDLMEPHSVLYA